MPPRWPRQPDRRDPDFRKLDDRMNFAVHVALFAALNSGLWFFRVLQGASWAWTPWLTGGWAILLLLHGLYIFAFTNYSDTTNSDTASRKAERI